MSLKDIRIFHTQFEKERSVFFGLCQRFFDSPSQSQLSNNLSSLQMHPGVSSESLNYQLMLCLPSYVSWGISQFNVDLELDTDVEIDEDGSQPPY